MGRKSKYLKSYPGRKYRIVKRNGLDGLTYICVMSLNTDNPEVRYVKAEVKSIVYLDNELDRATKILDDRNIDYKIIDV